ncbi:MAG: DUF4184 family protein [Bacteroidia bacterium]|nr:DUF4184 family protein [Bacteroidia bacterium]
MPFTLAHPALVMPLHGSRSKLSLTGLVIGSIAPDLEFLIQMREVENIEHQLQGIIFFDLPAAIILAFLFHNILRNSLITHLPNFYRRRFTDLLTFDWNAYAKENKAKIVISILIGIISHLGLDAFTHHDGWFVEMIPVLAYDIGINGHQLPIYFFLQIILSLIGMMMVHLMILKLNIQSNDIKYPPSDYFYWLMFAVLVTVIFSIRIVCWPEWNTPEGILIAFTGSLLYGWLPVSFLFNHYLKFKNY